MKKFLDRILPGGGKSKAPRPAKTPVRRSVIAASPPPPVTSSLDPPDLAGLNEQERRSALINHALRVKRARVGLVDNLDQRSQKVLRLMATAMANKVDGNTGDGAAAPPKARPEKDQDIIQRGQDLHAAMQAVRKILNQD